MSKRAHGGLHTLWVQEEGFAGFEESEKGISDVEAQISELRKSLDSPESKALSEKYNGIAKEFDAIKAGQDEAFKGLNSLRDERTKLQGEQSAKYAALKEVKDTFYKAKQAFQEYRINILEADHVPPNGLVFLALSRVKSKLDLRAPTHPASVSF